jgi:FkbM family methyltransferase
MSRFQNFDEKVSFYVIKNILKQQLIEHIDLEELSGDDVFCLYGLGDLGRLAIDYLKVIGRDPVAVLDECLSKNDAMTYWHDYNPIPLTELKPKELPSSSVAVAVTKYPFKIFSDKLQLIGFTNIFSFYDYTENFQTEHPLSNGWSKKRLANVERNKIFDALGIWSDDCSWAHFVQFVAWRLNRVEFDFKSYPVEPETRYFISEINSVIRPDEAVLDIGAHFGEFFKKYINLLGFSFEQYVAVEPDYENRAELIKVLDKNYPENHDLIFVSDKLIGATGGFARFAAGFGHSCRIHRTIGSSVPLTTIDALDLRPSFIKLHIEGGELDALSGALDTIEKCRPIVVATCYHNEDGLWKLPHFFRDNFVNYKLYFRLHGWCGTAAVIYAIPNERKPL